MMRLFDILAGLAEDACIVAERRGMRSDETACRHAVTALNSLLALNKEAEEMLSACAATFGEDGYGDFADKLQALANRLSQASAFLVGGDNGPAEGRG